MRENKSGLQTKAEGNTSTISGKHLNSRNTEVQQKTNDNATHTEMNYKITTAIFLSWYRTNIALLFFINIKRLRFQLSFEKS